MKKVTKIIHIGIYKPQQEVVAKIEEDGLSLAEIIRSAITEYGKEHYPSKVSVAEAQMAKLEFEKNEIERVQKERQRWEELDPKDYATNTLKGVVDEKKQVVYFFKPAGFGVTEVPLAEIKKYKTTEYPADDHLAVMKGEYIFPYGPTGPMPWTKEFCEERITEWRKKVETKLNEAK